MAAILAQAVAAGAVQQQIAAAVWSIVGLSWNSSFWIISQDAAQVTLEFSVAAPAGGGTIYYAAVPGPTPPATGTQMLSDYLTEVRRLLHDPQKLYWTIAGPGSTEADLIADINYGIRQRDLWSGGSRAYQTGIPLTTGVDVYSLPTLFPTVTVLDVVTIWLIYGQTRVQMDNLAMSDVTNLWRMWTGYQSIPGAWTRFGAGQVVIGTAPSMQYTTDWDLVTLSTTLVNPADLDPLPFPYTEPVAYFAAYKAKLNQRRFDEADIFLGFAQKALRDIEGSRVGEMMTAYKSRDYRALR